MSQERALLQRLAQGPVSGEELARDAGLTRAAMWKRVKALRDSGIEIGATRAGGYALTRPLELLEAEAVIRRLSPGAHAQLHALEVAWSLDSTNSELLRRPTPVVGASALLAERQTHGRGRRGRHWASPLAAHVYLSVARNFSGGLARLGGLSLVAGVATAESLREAGFASVKLKWPNDLVVDGRKLGGLLVEGGGEHGGPARAVVGIGLNVHMPPAFAARIDQPWIDLATLVQPAPAPARAQIVSSVLDHLLPAMETFDVEGLAPFLPRYERLDSLAGCQVQVHTGAQTLSGSYAGIAPDGALRVCMEGTTRLFHSGEVSVRPA